MIWWRFMHGRYKSARPSASPTEAPTPPWVTRREQVDALPPDERPTAVAADSDELAAALERLAAG